MRAFDLGCGSGATANMLSQIGFQVSGVDPSQRGISLANTTYPHLDLQVGSTNDDLSGFGQFPLVISLEVIEHCFCAKTFARCVRRLLVPGGIAIVSTPYHGYAKNLGLALLGRMDRHYQALRTGGHIKFWSAATIRKLFSEVELEVDQILRVGRLAPFAKSMIVVARKPVSLI